MNTIQRTRIINILNSMSIACSNENETAHCLATVACAMMDGRTAELSACISAGYDAPQEKALLEWEPLPEEPTTVTA